MPRFPPFPISTQSVINRRWYLNRFIKQFKALPKGPLRIQLLQRMADLVIHATKSYQTEISETYKAERRQWFTPDTIPKKWKKPKVDLHVKMAAGTGPCWACGTVGFRIWHHVIQIQHGGYNRQRNLVKLCKPCHAEIHPWLPGSVRKPRPIEKPAVKWKRPKIKTPPPPRVQSNFTVMPPRIIGPR
jgi:HNH endonuclease